MSFAILSVFEKICLKEKKTFSILPGSMDTIITSKSFSLTELFIYIFDGNKLNHLFKNLIVLIWIEKTLGYQRE